MKLFNCDPSNTGLNSTFVLIVMIFLMNITYFDLHAVATGAAEVVVAEKASELILLAVADCDETEVPDDEDWLLLRER